MELLGKDVEKLLHNPSEILLPSLGGMDIFWNNTLHVWGCFVVSNKLVCKNALRLMRLLVVQQVPK